MSGEKELLVLFLDRSSTISSKNDKLKKQLKLPDFFTKQYNFELCRNDWSYIIESLTIILRAIFDLFSKITVYICIDGNYGRSFSKMSSPGSLFKNLSDFFINCNTNKPKNTKREITLPVCSCINKFLKNENFPKPFEFKDFKEINCISIFSLFNERELRKAQESFDTFTRFFTNSIKNIYCYNVSRYYSMLHEDWVKNIEYGKLYNFRTIPSNFLPNELLIDIAKIYDLATISISDIPMKRTSTDEQLSFEVPIIIKNILFTPLISSETPNDNPNKLLKWLDPNNDKFLNTFHSVNFTEFTLLDTNKRSTASLISYLNEGKYVYLTSDTEPKSFPSYSLCNHGGIFCIHKLESHLEMVKDSIEPKILIGSAVTDYCTEEFLDLLRRSRLAPYPDNYSSAFKIETPSILSIECLKRDTLFLALTKAEIPLFHYLESTKILLVTVLKCFISDVEYNVCKNIINDLLNPEMLEKIQFVPNPPSYIKSKYQDKTLLKHDIIHSMYILGEGIHKFSSNHLKLFGLIRKKLFEKQVVDGEELGSGLDMYLPHRYKVSRTNLDEYIKQNSSKNLSLKDLWQNFTTETSTNTHLLPLHGEITPAFRLYKDAKISNIKDFRNEAVDM